MYMYVDMYLCMYIHQHISVYMRALHPCVFTKG